MLLRDFIECKREGQKHTAGSIRVFVQGFVKGEIPDYQVSAWLMAVYFRGLDCEEISELTKAMIASGQCFSRTSRDQFWIDKHSTGGVGDKTSLILVPLVNVTAERVLGKGIVKIPMVSGRGLGHTGGTLDKLESIPGFRTDLSVSEARVNLEKHGFFMMGQTDDFVPADRMLYALRDVTGTVDSPSLIVSSIMSKKIAEGIDGLVIDLKCGSAAFMKTHEKARALGTALIRSAREHGVAIKVWLTDMSEPLGRMVGNAIEVFESYEFLSDYRKADPGLVEVVLTLGSSMLEMASRGSISPAEAKKALVKSLEGSVARDCFVRMIENQGGDWRSFYEYNTRQVQRVEIGAEQSGIIQSIDGHAVGQLLVELGGGRKKVSDRVNPEVGFEFHRKVGCSVKENERLATAFVSNPQQREIAERLRDAIIIGKSKVAKRWVLECLN